MIHDFLYLWRNRERPLQVGRRFKVWLKRVYHAKSVVVLLMKPVFLRLRGAHVGRLVVVGKANIMGKRTKLEIGDETSIGRVQIALHDSVIIGRRVTINDGVIILTATHALDSPAWEHKKSPVRIGDYAWIAQSAMLLPGISIGRGAVVAAGAVVRCDVPNYGIAIGNPAKIMNKTRIETLAYSPVLFNAPFEAWVGPNQNLIVRE